jgi:hypothetical protein
MVDYDRNIVLWLMGLVPLSHMKILCKAVETTKKARKVATMITDKLQQIFRDDIWEIRCSRLKEMNLLHKDLVLASQRTSGLSSQIHDNKNQRDGVVNRDGNDIYGICVDDLDSNGQLIVKSNIEQETLRSCETDEVILSLSDKKLWVDKIVSNGLQKLVYGKYIKRKYVGWNKSYKYFSVVKGEGDDSGNEQELETDVINGSENNFLTNVCNL